MSQVERPALVLQRAKMKSYNTFRTRAILVVVLAELQPRTPEAILLLEDAVVTNCHLDRDGAGSSIEARWWSRLGEEEDVRPCKVVSLDIAWVERVPVTPIGCVEVGKRGCRGNAAVKDDGTGLVRLAVGMIRSSRRHG